MVLIPTLNRLGSIIFGKARAFHFSISHKIAAALLLLLVLMGIMIGITVYGSNKVFKNYDAIAELALLQGAAGNLRFSVAQLIMYTNDYIITENDNYRRRFEQQHSSVDKHLQELRTYDLSSDERVIVDAIAVDVDSIYAYAQRIFAIAHPMSVPEMAKLMETMDYTFGEAVNRKTTEIFDIIVRKNRHYSILSIQTKEQVQNLLNAMFVIGLVISLVVVYLSTQKIAKPIKSISKSADAIANGDYTQRPRITTRDEVGLLAVSFTRMAGTIESAHRALEDRARFTENILATVPSGLLTIGTRKKRSTPTKTSGEGLKVISVNRSFCELFGVHPQHIIGQPLKKVLATIDLSEKCREAVIAREPFRNMECIRSTPGRGEQILNLSLSRIRVAEEEEEEEEEVLLVIDDITEQKTAKQKLEQALEKTQKADKVKSIFLNNMSHEIRTPLNSLLGFMEMLKLELHNDLEDNQKEYFNIISASGKRLMRTVHEILDIAQLEADIYDIHKKPVRLAELLEDLIQVLRPEAEEKKLKLNFAARGDGDDQVKIDSHSVYQMLQYIIENAIKFTKKGRIDVKLMQSGSQLQVEIKDTGIGMAVEYQQRLFEIFSQESSGFTKKFQGIGLGLSIAKRYADMNGINIEVESTIGKGTTFVLTFPEVSEA